MASNDPTVQTESAEPGSDGAPSPLAVGRYQLTGVLGRGGMGVVVAAYDTDLDRPVALKLLHAGAALDSSVAAARIEREAQAMAKLSHPHVVTVYEVNRTGPRPFIAMELVAGVTLREWRDAAVRPWRAVLRLLISAGRGLAAAHAVGLVHRDFKPANVLVGSDGRARVSDFGLSSSLQGLDGTTAGTPPYMPPEQATGGEVDARTDQFAFAVTCWEILWGSRPYAAATPSELRARIASGVPSPIAARAGVPRRVEAILRRALAPAKADRWPELPAMLDALEDQTRDRRPLVALGATAVIAAGLAAALVVRGASDHAGSPCANAGAAVDARWSAARRQALAAAFAQRRETIAPAAWHEVERVLDRWAAEHRALRIETCELARGPARAAAAARTTCLDRRLSGLDALLGVLAAPDPTIVQYARAAALELPDSASCRELSGAERADGPTLASTRAELAPLHEQLARAAALRLLGKPREAVAAAQPVAARADALAWPAMIAEAYLELALDQQALQANAEGHRAHQRAAWFADASQDDRARFEATLGLSTAALDASDFDEADRQLESARMIARRLPDDDGRAVALAVQVGEVAYWRGDFAGCLVHASEALALIDRTLGRDTVAGARARYARGRCLGDLGRDAEAAVALREALAIVDATTGRIHPMAGNVLMNLGSVTRAAGHAEEAVGYLREALSIREQIFGADSVEVAKIHNNLGNALRELGRADEARAELERAVALWEAGWGLDSPAVANGTSGLGELAMDRGDFAAAKVFFERGLAIRRKRRPPGHIDIAISLVKLGRALLAQRDRACVALLEEALADYEAMPEVDPDLRADSRYQLGRALVELKVDRARGRALIAQACTSYADAAEVATCQATLATLTP